MKLTAFFLLTGLLAISAESYSQTQRLNLNMKDAQIIDVFNAIEQQSGFYFFYKNDEINGTAKVNAQFQDATIDNILSRILNNTGLNYKIVDKYIVISPGKEAAQSNQTAIQTIQGKVTDSSGSPLPGVTVVIKGTSLGAITDTDGKYSLRNVPGNATLIFSFVGMKTLEKPVDNKPQINVVMEEESIGLEEVVAIGYGSVRKADITTAVSVVPTKDLDQRPVTSVSAAIQGKSAGVQVVQPSGLPGEGMIIRIRGASSIASSNDPLYVVDGVPVGEGNYAISYLSPNEIESMQILKDASSAAIYGSRAANGVVLITTKNGGIKKPTISFSSFVGISKVTKTYDVLNVAQYKDLMDETGLVNLPDGLKDETDWFDYTYQTAINQNYQLSYAGRTNNSNFYVGGGYTDEDGVIKVAYNRRYNFKANLETQLRSWVKFNTTVNYVHYSNNGIISGTGSNRAGVVLSVINTPTYAKVWDEDNPDYYWTQFYGATLTTPAENMARTEHNEETTDRLFITAGATLDLTKGLTFKTTATMDRRWIHSTEFLDPIHTSYGRTQHGSASDARSDDRRIIYDNILSYKFSLGKHSFDVMGGTSATVSHWEDLKGSRSYFSDDYNNAIIGLNGGNNGGLRGQSADVSEWTIMSYLGRVSYNFNSKYLLTANIRADGSSKLAPGGRWGYFPSFSAAWRISDENFMKSTGWIDDLKLRVGWGQTGNQAGLDDYAYIQKYNINYYDWTDPDYAQATPTVGTKSNIKNEDLTWETTSQTDIGIDLTVLNQRLTFTLDAYYKYTKDMLMKVPLPAPNPDIIRNEGEMSNKGLEFSVSAHNIVKPHFRWDTDFNISLNRNKVKKLDFQQVYYYAKTSEALNEYAVRMTPGKPLSSFWGYIAEGVDPETGDMTYRDLDDNGVINSSDKTYIGNANPKFIFGMTNTFSWKGFTLNVLVNGSVGNDIYNASKIEMEGMYTGGNQITDVLRRWRIPGQITDIPRANDLDNLKMSTRWIENGSYLKVKNITLAYDFNTQRLKKWNITRIQPYVSLENFITWTNYSGYDPEVSQYNDATEMGIDWGTYPHVKKVVFGINVDF